MEDLQRVLEQHLELEDRHYTEVKTAIESIKNNHLAHIEPNIASIKTDVDWLKKIVSGALLASISSFIGILYQLIRE